VRAREKNRVRSISAQPSDEAEDFAQETPEAALVAAQAYLLTTQPEPGDPREHMHQAAIKSLGLVEDKLRKHSPEKKSTCYEDKGNDEGRIATTPDILPPPYVLKLGQFCFEVPPEDAVKSNFWTPQMMFHVRQGAAAKHI
jgi:hypothetical protein